MSWNLGNICPGPRPEPKGLHTLVVQQAGEPKIRYRKMYIYDCIYMWGLWATRGRQPLTELRHPEQTKKAKTFDKSFKKIIP